MIDEANIVEYGVLLQFALTRLIKENGGNASEIKKKVQYYFICKCFSKKINDNAREESKEKVSTTGAPVSAVL